MGDVQDTLKVLKRWNPQDDHHFSIPQKKINDGEDVSFWLTSVAYADIMTFLLQLNVSMFPQKTGNGVTSWPLDTQAVPLSPAVRELQSLLSKLSAIIDEAPPDTGPRRFGNVSFRKWYEIVSERCTNLLQSHLPQEVFHLQKEGEGSAMIDELKHYLLGSFGSAQRLDYGTGHELSFLAFLAGIWKLGGFNSPASDPGVQERGIVLGLIEPYLRLVRQLILKYTLEPAGSHGVWGLDDHAFLPYIFGSAQFAAPITSFASIPLEGSLSGAPNPGDVAKKLKVDRERRTNMYFSAIGFIYDVKKGPFWEHSPILYDVSGVTAGWAKINKGMLKMYNAEVLSKFPVVQHFPFGSLFKWERDLDAPSANATSTVHTQQQPRASPQQNTTTTSRPSPGPGTQAPWASSPGAGRTGLPQPHAIPHPAPGRQPGIRGGPMGMPPFQAPWASARGSPTLPPSSQKPSTPTAVDVLDAGGINAAATAAPWAQKPGIPAKPGESEEGR